MTVLKQLLEQIQELVARDFAASPGELRFAVGDLEEERFDAPPRIAWVEGDTCPYRPARHPGGNARHLWVRVVPLRVVIWGDDDEHVASMIASVLQAFDALCTGSYRPIEDVRPEPEDNKDQGRLRILSLEVDTFVTEKEYLLAYPQQTGFDASAALPGDGRLDANERP